jgi:hypothetical protein
VTRSGLWRPQCRCVTGEVRIGTPVSLSTNRIGAPVSTSNGVDVDKSKVDVDESKVESP